VTAKARKKKPQLIKTKWGFYQYRPLPSEEELREYYANKYYQEGHGSYEVSYSSEEITWHKLKSWLIHKKTERIMREGPQTLIDIGCGEGWLMAEFYQQGHAVKGLDFSITGIEKFNPHLMPFFEQGNIYDLLEIKIAEQVKFDIISLCNVIEHVTHPIELLQNIKNIMHAESLMIMTAPNDFSPLHEHLIENDYVSKKWWLSYPDHLSYFNKETMCNVLTDLGFAVNSIVADNPIDLNLLNDNSNYIKDRTKGKNTHLFRVRTDNFLASVDREKLLEVYEILGSMGVGRDLTYYCSLNV